MARPRWPESPFPAASVVTGGDFADREDEIALLRQELREGGRVFLLAYRRYGKSCLIHETFRRLQAEDRLITVYVDLYRATSEREFWELFTNAVLSASRSPSQQAVQWVTSLFRFRPTFSVDPQTQMPTVTFDAARTPAALSEVRNAALELPAVVARKRGVPVVVALDEFQEIRTLDGPRLEKLMRGAFQTHRGVGYLFAGSKPHVLRRMAEEPDAPFYRFGRLVELGPIPGKAWTPYLVERFRRGKITVAADALTAIYAVTDGIPYYVIRLCRLLWVRGLRSARLEAADVQEAFGGLVAEAGELCSQTWDGLPLSQRRVLVALGEGRGQEVFSEAVRHAYEIGPSSTVARSLDRLVELGLVAREGGRTSRRYRIVDPLLAAWVRRQRPVAPVDREGVALRPVTRTTRKRRRRGTRGESMSDDRTSGRGASGDRAR